MRPRPAQREGFSGTSSPAWVAPRGVQDPPRRESGLSTAPAPAREGRWTGHATRESRQNVDFRPASAPIPACDTRFQECASKAMEARTTSVRSFFIGLDLALTERNWGKSRSWSTFLVVCFGAGIPHLNWEPADYEVAGDRRTKLGTAPCLEDVGLNLGSSFVRQWGEGWSRELSLRNAIGRPALTVTVGHRILPPARRLMRE